MNSLYPLKFRPFILDKIWGGNKLHSYLNKDTASDKAGESWEISTVNNYISKVSDGFLKDNNLHELIEIYMGDLLGDKVFDKFGYKFPLLIKFIDAADNLSIQVHPDDTLAKKRHGSSGKTEMWYVIQADENATITTGFNKQITREEYLKLLNDNNLESILNTEKTTAGDVFFLPAGRIHAIGAGTLLAEIQQASDITYRIYDYDRKDASGNLRELHTGLALDAIDYNFYGSYKTDYPDKLNDKISLADCAYFHTNLYNQEKPVEMDFFGRDSFVIIICTEGKLKLDYQNGMIDVSRGETVLIPAVIKNIYLTPLAKSRFMEVYVP